MAWDKLRTFALTTVACKSELLAYFGAASWPHCTALQLDALMFVSRCRPAGMTPSFAVIREGRHIATLPLAQMSRREVSAVLDDLMAGGGSELGVLQLETEPADHHVCEYCQPQVEPGGQSAQPTGPRGAVLSV